MLEFWMVALIVAALWILFSARSKGKAVRSFAATDAARSWFSDNDIDYSSVLFSTYEDEELARNPGASIIVGSGRNSGGESVGFALEVLPGSGVVESEMIVPDGIASHHRSASLKAKRSGQPLLDILVEMAARHRAQYSEPS